MVNDIVRYICVGDNCYQITVRTPSLFVSRDTGGALYKENGYGNFNICDKAIGCQDTLNGRTVDETNVDTFCNETNGDIYPSVFKIDTTTTSQCPIACGGSWGNICAINDEWETFDNCLF